MRKGLLILFLLTMTSWTILGQTDSVGLRRLIDQRENVERKRDSLETVFLSARHFFEISFELNHKKASLPDNASFYVTDGHRKYDLKKMGDDKYDFDELPDSLKFGLVFDSVKLETEFIKKSFYKNGARIRFGYFDNVVELRKMWLNGQHTDDFVSWTQTDPYLEIINDKKVIRAAKRHKIKPIEFIVYVPTTYGDGSKVTYRTIRLK